MRLVFLIAQQRSGTTALRSALLHNHNIEDFGEAFNPDAAKYAGNLYHFLRLDNNYDLMRPGQARSRFLKYYQYIDSLADKPIGIIDAKYDMLRAFDPEVHELSEPPYLFSLLDDVGASVIHLARNPFHVYVSHRVAVETSIFHLSTDDDGRRREVLDNMSIIIDVDDMVDYISKRVFESDLISKSLGYCSSTIKINYDDIFTSDGEFDSEYTWGFLGLNPEKIRPYINKSVKREYRDFIENYEQVEMCLSKNGFSNLIY